MHFKINLGETIKMLLIPLFIDIGINDSLKGVSHVAHEKLKNHQSIHQSIHTIYISNNLLFWNGVARSPGYPFLLASNAFKPLKGNQRFLSPGEIIDSSRFQREVDSSPSSLWMSQLTDSMAVPSHSPEERRGNQSNTLPSGRPSGPTRLSVLA